MSKEVVKKTLNDLVAGNEIQNLAKLDVYNSLINAQPPAQWLKTNPFANNSKYLPIDKVEYLLTKLFKEWHVEVKNVSVLFNSISVEVRLHYYNPVLSKWQYQDGVGAKQIQTKKGTSPASMENINNNAVEMALPIAKVNAMKDASHNIGALFGGNLNRKEVIAPQVDEKLQDKAERERYELLKAQGIEIPTELKEKFENETVQD